MRLPQFLSLVQVKTTFARFYFSFLSSAIATGLILFRIWTTLPYNEVPEFVDRLMACALLGIPLFAGLALFAEKYNLRRWLLQLVGVPVLYLFLYRLDQNPSSAFMINVLVLSLATGCLLVSAPYFTASKEKHFWAFAMQIIYRASVTFASVLILTGGFALALYSVETLFEVDIANKYYETLNTILPVLGGTLIFLSGIPNDFKEEIKKSLLTKSLKFFAHYLSFPLLATYFAILAVYSAKILITWNWPNGFVATPILIFAMIGLATYTITAPVREETELKFIRFFSRAFFWVLLPLLAVYFMGFWQRISEYGITEPRYFGVLIGVWLVALSLYFGIYKKANLKLITVSAFVIGFLTLLGPQSAFSVSEWSQMNRLTDLLSKNGMIEEGKIVALEDGVVNDDDLVQISSILDYMQSNHGLTPVIDMFADPSIVRTDSVYGEMNVPSLMLDLGLDYSSRGQTVNGQGEAYNSYFVTTRDVRDVSGYDSTFSYMFSYWPDNGAESKEKSAYNLASGKTAYLYTDFENLTLNLEYDGEAISIPLTEFIDNLAKAKLASDGSISSQDMYVFGENNSVKMKVYFDYLNLQRHRDESINQMDFDAKVFLQVK
ncbi:MAG: DUF4153 domain-containing protein [Candidatus Gracilibacteria bacterium]